MAIAKRRAGKLTDCEADQADDDEEEPAHDRRQIGHVVGAGGRRRGVRIADVHQPVAERPPRLDRRRRQADVLERLRVGEQVGALATLDDLHRQPPRRRGERQPADARRRGDGATSGHGALGDGDEQPQHGSRGDHQHRRRVDGADGADDERAQRGVTPAGACRRPDRQPDDPAESGPRQEHRRRPRHVGDEIRRELVEQPGGDRRLDRETEAARRPGDAGTGGEHDRADPQTVGDPVGQTEGLGGDVPRAARPGVGDHLVGHPAGELAGVERPDRVADEPAGIEVQVQLGVGRHPSRRRQQRRHVGEQRHRRRVPTTGPVVSASARIVAWTDRFSSESSRERWRRGDAGTPRSRSRSRHDWPRTSRSSRRASRRWSTAAASPARRGVLDVEPHRLARTSASGTARTVSGRGAPSARIAVAAGRSGSERTRAPVPAWAQTCSIASRIVPKRSVPAL